ncbi:MAG: hypothetical protein QOF62_991 [Pyrinomonadaceae bacterium]|jgi:hypothetical protein|nr:hypothetical protein [Pyrinomonadaceae bacterium]
MDRNKKIAIGCGGAGCLGLILIVIVCVVLLSTGYITMPGNSNSNRNENFNATNTNSNTNSNLNENTNSNSSTSSSSLSDDDKHKLFQAAGMTRDNALIQKVLRKIGLLTPDNDLSDDYASFTKKHVEWAKSNTTFIQSVLTPEKARAYVDEHMND